VLAEHHPGLHRAATWYSAAVRSALPLLLLCACGPAGITGIAVDRINATADGTDAVNVTASAPSGTKVSFTTTGGTLAQASVVADAKGAAVTQLSSSTPGTFTVSASAGTTTATVNVTFASARRLRFQTSPGNTVAQNLLRPVPEVWVEEGGGVVASSAASITVAVTPGSCNATLDATSLATVNAAQGKASFYGLKISAPATGCRLTATSGTLAPAVSTSFDVL
jgi:hypothetical protein